METPPNRDSRLYAGFVIVSLWILEYPGQHEETVRTPRATSCPFPLPQPHPVLNRTCHILPGTVDIFVIFWIRIYPVHNSRRVLAAGILRANVSFIVERLAFAARAP